MKSFAFLMLFTLVFLGKTVAKNLKNAEDTSRTAIVLIKTKAGGA